MQFDAAGVPVMLSKLPAKLATASLATPTWQELAKEKP